MIATREIDFVKFNPTQNMTILVTTRHPPEEYPLIASRMMSYDHVHAEQVGFVEQPRHPEAAARLQMAGGEFCGNACMALAAYLASGQGLRPDDDAELSLEASGTDRLVACQVRRTNEAYLCRVAMPIPREIERRTVPYEDEEWQLAFVRYPDCWHMVIEVDSFGVIARKRAQEWAKLLGAATGANLIGVLLFKADSYEMAPLIYIPSLSSMVWERGCGSGTATIGAYLSWISGRTVTAPIKQPGGTIRVTSLVDRGEIASLSIEGSVGIVAQGRAYLEDEPRTPYGGEKNDDRSNSNRTGLLSGQIYDFGLSL